MTLIQLEYIIAVSNLKHFAKAANFCNVTQPTLSMQIQKLEEEFEVKIFDRSKQPVIPTILGEKIIEQAKRIIAEKENLSQLLIQTKGETAGELKIGIIPTLAPYLLPLFLNKFIKKYPKVKLKITELNTNSIIKKLKENTIDIGILVTPLNEKVISETPLFYEELMAYISKRNKEFNKTYMLTKDIDIKKLWLLEEGHCFRTQVLNLCELRKNMNGESQFEYAAGSFETLRKMVDVTDGLTILPELATEYFSASEMQRIRHFKAPAPVREISIVLHRNYAKQQLVTILKDEILNAIPEKIKKNKKTFIVPFESKES
ncbi:MAG TPA: LysR substrate-binding domain-containing protein [Chitinophagaceae bacterium]|nr:LysR family transcriptional regulator [Chitinophagaceae bacterium]MCC6634143.1 LysR family transcriptional regulator [Chitinophagaceae bacterium]HMZ45498.1 LysR substrate-binding domain-containing protein [Chitinophagaceae bacterium]HNE93764.1 LysR substrate-binding domain-containing protein [Chitinophagaceae bacterium]HNF29557.1 LysR substrate-binding domain-containing protein [Chitinophagaceae bacterium]